MALKQEHALLVGVATAGVVFGLHSLTLPPVASVRASKAGNTHVDSSRKTFTITATSLVALIALLASDPTVFIVGGISVIALDANMRVANATDHKSGKLPAPAGSGTASAGEADASAISIGS